MTTLPSISYLFIILLSFGISLEVKAVDLEVLSNPATFRIDDQISLVREKCAAADLSKYFEARIEISFPEGSMAMDIASFLEKNLNTLSLGNSTTICSVDFAPVKPNITASPGKLFRGDTGIITCNFSEVTNVSWSHNSMKILHSSKYNTSSTQHGSIVLYELKITDLGDSDTGNYTCSGTINGISQILSIVINIFKVEIIASSNIETFCDGSKWSISCCSGDIDSFNVTWLAEDGTGEESSNTTCTIYTMTADSTRCSFPQPRTYTCNFQRNEGARASKIITINYITKGNINISVVSPISEGKPMNITCFTDVNVEKIDLAKDTTDNVKASGKKATLLISNTSHLWSGIFICTAYQGNLSSSQTKSVEVVPLPRSEAIQVFPLQTYVKCDKPAEMKCCVFDQNYTITFRNATTDTPVGSTAKPPSSQETNVVCYSYTQLVECTPNAMSTVSCIITNKLHDYATSDSQMTIRLLDGNTCKTDDGNEIPSGSYYSVPCRTINPSQLGNIIYPCENGIRGTGKNECFSESILLELQNIKDLINGPDKENYLPLFLENILKVAKEERENIKNSPKNIEYMVEIIALIASSNINVSKPMIENFIQTVDIVVDNGPSWETVSNLSYIILKSVETVAKHLQLNDSKTINIENTSNMQLFGKVVNSDTKYDKNFLLTNLSGSVTIESGTLAGNSNTVVTIAYSTMKDLMPRNYTKKVNTLVMSTVISNFSSGITKDVFKIIMTFTKDNTSLKNPDCTWLDVDNQYWRSSGCQVLDDGDTVVKCSCDHLTSFSILMANVNATFLDKITYAGVGISIASLVLTLVIEAVVWRTVIKNKTSYMRHVCLVNIAVTLLTADIWFIIGAALEKDPRSKACTTAAFFTFYFYLSLFFWMLVLGLILFYRLIYILHDMSRRIMMIIAFTLGYGCPLLIATITVASTAPSERFTSGQFCWLDFNDSKTSLAFIIPALSIVFVNFIILIVVIVKLLRPAIGERPGREERKNLVVVAKSIAVLTPLLGTSWALGLVLSFDPTNLVIHGIFAALNSFQGLFILISTVLLDQNVRKAVRSSISTSYWSTLRTKVQTSTTNSSASSKPFRRNILKKGGGYNFHSAQGSSNDPSTNSNSAFT
ncbi:adhesion G protein-coupled receptor F5-like [Rhinoderma darwinii]|uniref:adhesion G protein-coupled receptor F5-like n=1 Tax=Rhinoderma darwinii TaxID=43563 RepID=UPI003F6725E6